MTVTQEHLGTALGVGRPTVSQVAGTLQRQGLIRYRRGKIEILDRAGLESAACTCYREIRNAYETLLGVPFA